MQKVLVIPNSAEGKLFMQDRSEYGSVEINILQNKADSYAHTYFR